METIIKADYGTTRRGVALANEAEWLEEIEVSGWYNPIRIESTNKEYLEELLTKLPKYVSARIGECGSQIAVEDEDSITYFKPKWFALGTYFANNSQTTKGANETAIKRANKMFKLIENYSIETQTREDSVCEWFKNNLDAITEKHTYTKEK